ncbi:hypothetical protein V8D89_013872 [Ganoderma adspersum]
MPSVISAAEQHFLQFAIQWSSIALLYYDYLLTFPTEVRYIWRDKLKVSTMLYVLYRYALPANVLYLLAISNKLGNQNLYLSPDESSSCDTAYKAIGVISLGAIGVTCVILDCMPRFFDKSTLGLYYSVCVFEASATILTFVRSIQALSFGGGSMALKKHTLDYLIVEQGVLYFGLVSVFTVGATVLNFKAAGGFPQRLLNAITLPVSGLLTARFILRIRAYNQNKNPLGGSSHTTSNNFSSFNAASRNAAGARPSLADEFGEDPYDMVFRVSQSSANATTVRSLESEEGGGPKYEDGGGVVAELLEQMRRGMERADYGDSDGISSMGESRFDEEKHQTMVMDGDTVGSDANEHGRDGRSSAEVQVTARGSGSGEFVAGGSG